MRPTNALSPLEAKLLAAPPSVRRRVLQLAYAPDAVRALTDEPELCAGCGEPHHLFVSRDGRTVCWACDGEAQRAAAARDRARLGLA